MTRLNRMKSLRLLVLSLVIILYIRLENPGASSQQINKLVDYIVNSNNNTVSLKKILRNMDEKERTVSFPYPNTSNLSKI